MRAIIVKMMPSIYFELELIQRQGFEPAPDFLNRRFYLPYLTNLEVVLFLLLEYQLTTDAKFEICLAWDNSYYYFKTNGEYSVSFSAPGPLA